MPLGVWALEQACQQAVRWHRVARRAAPVDEREPLPRQLAEPALRRTTWRACCTTPASGRSALWLEITESTLMRDAESALTRSVRSAASVCTSRSTTSVPATRRSPTSSGCRSRRSRSTVRSSPGSGWRPTTPRSWKPSSASGTPPRIDGHRRGRGDAIATESSPRARLRPGPGIPLRPAPPRRDHQSGRADA